MTPTECPRCHVTSERRPDGSCRVCGDRPAEGETSTRATQEAHVEDPTVKEAAYEARKKAFDELERAAEEHVNGNGSEELRNAFRWAACHYAVTIYGEPPRPLVVGEVIEQPQAQPTPEAERMAFEQLERAAAALAYSPIADATTVARNRERLRAAARCFATAVNVEPKHAEITLEPGEGIAELTRSIERISSAGVGVMLKPREARCIAAWITGITGGQIRGTAPQLPAGWTLDDAMHSLRLIADEGGVGAAWPSFSRFLVSEVRALKELVGVWRKKAERTAAIEGAMVVARRHLDDAIARLAAEATGLERLQLEGVARALGRARATLDDSTSSEAPSASYEAQLKAELGEHLAAAVATDEERTDPVLCPDEQKTGTCSHEGCRARRERAGQ